MSEIIGFHPIVGAKKKKTTGACDQSQLAGDNQNVKAFALRRLTHLKLEVSEVDERVPVSRRSLGRRVVVAEHAGLPVPQVRL